MDFFMTAVTERRAQDNTLRKVRAPDGPSNVERQFPASYAPSRDAL